MAYKLDTVHKRSKLAPRTEPYWDVLGAGKALGYRKAVRNFKWKARFKADGKSVYTTLGDDLSFEEAKLLAEQWFVSVAGAENHRYTVANAIADYLDDLGTRSSKRSVYDSRLRLNKHLTPSINKTLLSELTTRQLQRWHRSMVRTDTDDPELLRKSKDTANRTLSSFKAALNMAFNSGTVASDLEWRRVKPFQKVTSARKVFLSDQQVSDLLRLSVGAFKALLTAALLTGARYGELAGALTEDFDSVAGTLDLSGKTGSRTVMLSDDATAFFKQLTATRMPKSNLLVKDDGSPWGESHQQRPWVRLKVKAKLPADAVFYSLRHYHISKALKSRMPMQALAENCGTSVRMIEKHYGKFLDTDKRQMMNSVSLGVNSTQIG